jgi:hypothetical protein
MHLSVLTFFAVVVSSLTAVAGDLPDPEKTPGEANPVLTQEKICAKGFTTKAFRNVPASLKAKVYAAYGMRNHKGACGGKEGCEVDHEISIELGGSNSIKNLWIQPYSGMTWNAHVKDRLENALHRLVCTGKVDLAQAQKEISDDWIATYRRYLGEPKRR